MLPTVVRLTRLGIYRDGGSLTACFESSDNTEYCLLFPINFRLSPSEFEAPRFMQPLLERYIRTEYKSPMTGVVSPEFKKESGSVSWSEARALLDSMEPQLEGFDSDYLWVFESMREAAAEDGAR